MPPKLSWSVDPAVQGLHQTEDLAGSGSEEKRTAGSRLEGAAQRNIGVVAKSPDPTSQSPHRLCLHSGEGLLLQAHPSPRPLIAALPRRSQVG